ncbi:transposase family protein, partial [Pseudomonas aeruginosa]
LPQQRVTPCRPFTFTGVDYSGYIELKINKGRGVKTSKGYIAIFICMATKAVHIELVSDLGTETFIAAFQRLCARRGTPKHMYSDCGTNFIGAAKVLGQEFKNFKQIMTPEFFDELAKLEVEWHFNAPAWPSAGGLWEAAVKSMKRHLRRVLGD